MKPKLRKILALLLFAIGAIVSMVIAAISFTGDMEATLFQAELANLRDESLPTLKCPVFVTTSAPGTVRATFKNPLDEPVTFNIRAHISQYLTMWREENTTISVAAHGSERLEWAVSADDAVQGNLILVKVLRFRKYPLPALLGSCGILVVNLPFGNGNQLLILGLAVTVLGLAGGTILWMKANRPLIGQRLNTTRALQLLTVTLLVGLTLSLLGGWVLGILLLVLNLLFIGVIVGSFVTGSS
jgi:hypothetical protein